MFVDDTSAEPEVTDKEVDELLSKHESGTLDSPAIVEDQVAAPVVAPVVEAPKIEEHEFTHNGKQIKATLDQLKKWAQQGYDYPQKMAEFNKQREQIVSLENSYKPIDEWVKANPDKWEKLQSVIKAEQQGTVDLPPQIVQKLEKYDEAFAKLEARELAATNQLEDQKLDTEIKSIQEKYKDLDWVSVDDSGRTREQRVLNHAAEHGHRTFKTAFLDLYHEDLLKAAETRAKEQVVANKERQAKTGLLANKQAPEVKASKTPGKHYQPTHEILEELGIQ